MTPRIATSLASRLVGYRWHILAVTICALAILLAIIVVGHNPRLNILCFAAMGPLVLLPWGLFCACMGFGPQGKYRQPNPMASNFVRIIGWIFALFLGVYVVCGTILWPLSVAA